MQLLYPGADPASRSFLRRRTLPTASMMPWITQRMKTIKLMSPTVKSLMATSLQRCQGSLCRQMTRFQCQRLVPGHNCAAGITATPPAHAQQPVEIR